MHWIRVIVYMILILLLMAGVINLIKYNIRAIKEWTRK